MGTDARRKLVPALKVHQWLDEWDEIDWRVEENRSKPQKCFFQFNMPAPQLRALCGIYPRSAEARESASEDTGIQRRHEPGRSKEISRFVRFGYLGQISLTLRENLAIFENCGNLDGYLQL